MLAPTSTMVIAFTSSSGERRSDRVAREEFERVRNDIHDRIARLCTDWPHEELLALITQMARVQLKYRRRASPSVTPSGRG